MTDKEYKPTETICVKPCVWQSHKPLRLASRRNRYDDKRRMAEF
jgi:hypothetical protein